MKKTITLIVGTVLGVSVAFAQTDKPKSQGKPNTTKPAPQTPAKQQPQEQKMSSMGEHFLRKYSVASRWNDLDVAKDALYDLIVEYPNSDSLIFALAAYYYDNQKYPSSALVGQDLLGRTPRNPQVLEVVASSYENLNIMDRAVQYYESLYLITNAVPTLYKMAVLQYQLKKYSESMTNIDILLANPEVDTLKVVFNDAQKKAKEYAMRVSILNLKGMVYKDQGDKVNAKKAFDDALKIAPDFVLAKENSDSLK
jgi:tetratricopeptide (TPR) repeat protein